MTIFTPHQDSALKSVASWLKAKPGRNGTPRIFRLFGYAGTGKTTLAKHVAEGVDGKVLFASFTGKAAQVMRNKGCNGASTIHSLIYRARESGEQVPQFDLWDDAPASKAELIVDRRMLDGRCRARPGSDVVQRAAAGARRSGAIAAGQWRRIFHRLRSRCHAHRGASAGGGQSDHSPVDGGPRREERCSKQSDGETEVLAREDLDPSRVMEADQVLVGRNHTRRTYNARLRFRRGIEGSLPEAGEKLVCLRNNKRKGLLNGALFEVATRGRGSPIVKLTVRPEESAAAKPFKVSVRPECFTAKIEDVAWDQRKRYDEFDYGYVLTVHKAQGSEWDDVVLFDESSAFGESRQRWLYTGITRAAKRLTIVM